jgi:hypothetical protein
MYEAPPIIGTCINCITPGSLNATLAVIFMGVGVALTASRRKLLNGPSDEYRSKKKTATVAGRSSNFEEVLLTRKREASEVTKGPSGRSAMPTFNYRRGWRIDGLTQDDTDASAIRADNLEL